MQVTVQVYGLQTETEHQRPKHTSSLFPRYAHGMMLLAREDFDWAAGG